MIARLKSFAKRHWPRLGLRTILLGTLILVATLPGWGALFLRIYENTLVRQTESELIAEGAALAAATATDWPGFVAKPTPVFVRPELPSIDLRGSQILPDRPAPSTGGPVDPAARIAAARIAPVLAQTTPATLASVLLLDAHGRVASGPLAGRSYATLPEVRSALRGNPATTLRHNSAYRRTLPIEWLSRSADLGIHHAQSIRVNGRVVGALLLSRSPPALYMGLYADAGKIAVGFALILGFVIVLSGILSRGIVRPIERLGAATRDLARGAAADIPAVPEMAAVEIQALYADFASMAAAIERRSRYLRDFAHAVSHEFKTPLAGIRGAVELLQDHHAAMSEAERQRFLGNAAMDAERLATLVTRLLELARADMTPAGSEASAPAPLLRRLADAYSGANFAVVLELPAELPLVAVPAGTIETVIGGMIDNSRRAGAHRCSISAALSDDRIQLHIRDDGPGIAPADRDRLFEPFFTTRRADGGTGLGLPIARSLLDACDGTIRLEDIPGSPGACFVITLPLA
jgi:signal transduction histidine kinase